MWQELLQKTSFFIRFLTWKFARTQNSDAVIKATEVWENPQHVTGLLPSCGPDSPDTTHIAFVKDHSKGVLHLGAENK